MNSKAILLTVLLMVAIVGGVSVFEDSSLDATQTTGDGPTNGITSGDDTTTAEPTIVSAEGKTSTGSSAASWKYDCESKTLTITVSSTTNQISALDSDSSTSWGSWSYSVKMSDNSSKTTFLTIAAVPTGTVDFVTKIATIALFFYFTLFSISICNFYCFCYHITTCF